MPSAVIQRSPSTEYQTAPNAYPATAAAIEAMGGQHKTCTVDLIHADENNRIVTTPAYMLGPGIKDVAEGIQKLVDKVVELAG